MGFLNLGSQNRLIPSGAILVDVGEKQLIGRLTVWPNDEEMPLTDLSCKVRKNIHGSKRVFPKNSFWAEKPVFQNSSSFFL